MKRNPEISLKLKKIRLAFNFTQQYVARQIKISRKWYGMIENGEAAPTEPTLVEIANLYNVKLEDIENFNEKQPFPKKVNGAGSQLNQSYAASEAERTIEAQKQTIATLNDLLKAKSEIIELLKK